MNLYMQLLFPALGAVILTLIFIPILRRVAVKLKLVDLPNSRKVHTEPIPVVGGIVIAISISVVLLFNTLFHNTFFGNSSWIIGAFVLLVMGVSDDKLNIKAVYRLCIQFFCAFLVALSGIRIESLYGLFGIEQLPLLLQYGLTVTIIAGVVNAYNLMDGIDGLLGGLTIVCAAVLLIVSIQLKQYDLSVLYVTIIGSSIGFLKHNLSKKKIFMGDAGSMFLGFILIVTALKLMGVSNSHNSTEQLKLILIIAGVFLVPVVDSLRVYRSRIKRGQSPFRADKTHLHHLFLFLGITHKTAALLIIGLVVLIVGIISTLVYFIPFLWVILIGFMLFAIVTTVLGLNRSVIEWREKLKTIESE